MPGRTFRLWRSREWGWVLLGLHGLLVAGCFVALRGSPSADQLGYQKLAESLAHGRFSPWYDRFPEVSDTLRTMGYPLLILLSGGTQRPEATLLLQAAMYGLSIVLALDLIRRLGRSYGLPAGAVRPIAHTFLVLLLPCLQLPYYAAQVLPEIPMACCMLLLLWLHERLAHRPAVRACCQGLVLGVAFAIRPVVWPVAVAWLLVDAWPRRNRWLQARQAALRLLVFGLLLVPHGLSNAIRHGHCSPLPLDGSEPYLHLAYWQHLLPGEYDNHLWQGTYMGHELFPLAAPADLDGNRRAYAEDWALVERACDPLLTDGDRRRLAAMDSIPGLFRTWPAAYVLARRKALMQRLLVRIQERPCYYLLSRVYTGLRLWVTGFSVKSWRQPGWKAKAAALYPMLVTLVVLGMGWLVVAWCLLTRRLPLKPVRAILLVCLTYWGVHLVMPIQSRYTVPLHLPVLVLVSFALASLWLQLKPADGPQPAAEPEKTR